MAKIFPLSEGEFTIGRDKIFMPFDLEKDNLNERATGSLLVEVQPFLVVTSRDVIVLDAGLGFNGKSGRPQIHENLAQHGFNPGDVTKVLMSHLHKDHAGGVTYTDEHGAHHPTFPYATYYIYRPEWDFALAQGKPSFIPEEIEPLKDEARIEWLEGEQGTIDGYIHYTHSGAHSPEHIVFLIDDEGGKIFFGGDEAPQLKQMIVKYVAKYDYDGKKAMQLREEYMERGKKEGWQFLFYHDVQSPVTRL